MKKNYRITIFTTEGVIEGKFYNKEIAINTIIESKRRFEEFKIGILSERIKGKWNPICSIINERSTIIHYL